MQIIDKSALYKTIFNGKEMNNFTENKDVACLLSLKPKAIIKFINSLNSVERLEQSRGLLPLKMRWRV